MITIRIKLSTVVLVPALLVALTLGAVLSTSQAQAQGTTLLWLDPPNASAFPGGSTSLTARLDDASNVYGAEIHLSFDPSVLAVVDANPGQPGVQIGTGSCPAPGFVVTNSADNAAGTIDYALTQLSPQLPCDGGDVATIEFECLGSDASGEISFTSSVVSDPDGVPIGHTTQSAAVECLSNVFSIEGAVALQAWPDPTGTTVTLLDADENPVGAPVSVGSDGSFSIMAEVGTTYIVQASHDRYLSARATGITGSVGETVDLGMTSLPVGDVNGDGTINILDITTVASNFGESSPVNWGE